MEWGGYQGTPTNYGYPGMEYDQRYARPYDYAYPQQPNVDEGASYQRAGGWRTRGGWDPGLGYDYSPPPLTWNPQPGWGGYEFASAHSQRMGRGVYDGVVGGLRGYYENYRSDQEFARAAHQMVYWQRDLYNVSSRELGAAAAFEAFLYWMREGYGRRGWDWGGRGFESLIGLATGEAHNLSAQVGANLDPRREDTILRTAAATARQLYALHLDEVEDEYDVRHVDYGGGESRYIEGPPPLPVSRRGRGPFSSYDFEYGDSPSFRRRSLDDGYGGRSHLSLGPASLSHGDARYAYDSGSRYSHY